MVLISGYGVGVLPGSGGFLDWDYDDAVAW